ncbi:cyanophycinase [Belliella buryatensis]|uniref:Cyanophycinase n=1 Tax=Belliella buryatensis TaxID=1500549 RepID=A0A239B011_9BACT|nr:cyanophycinase [Belliella buryatensis]SNS01305.1 cyanophycinase [Belliella buryatensis]
MTILPLVFSMMLACGGDEISAPIPPNQDGNPFSLGRVGSSDDIQTSSSTGVVLMGGSTDVDQAFRWMIEKSGGGDFVVIRVTGADAYNNYILGLGNVNSVETLRINTLEAANDPKVIETLRNAEAVFIAGGDQSNYLRLWEGTKVEEALQYLIQEKQIPIGGTSAGCAIMGEYVYTGENGSIISTEALANPFDERLTVRKSSLINHPLLRGVITDQHFSQRNREGRLFTFMARLSSESELPVRGIAVDERTALLIDSEGSLEVVGQNEVYFLEQSGLAPEVMSVGVPLTWDLEESAIKVFKARTTTTFNQVNLSHWLFDWTHYWYAKQGQLGVRNY